MVRTRDHGRLDGGVRAEAIFNRYRRDVFTLTGLEQVFDPPRDPQPPALVDLTHVAGLEEAVLRVALGRELGLLVVAHHLSGTLHEHFPVLANPALYAVVDRADVARARLAHARQVRVRHVLAH